MFVSIKHQPLNRFEETRKNSHFTDNSNELSRSDLSYDRAFKIRPDLDHFNKAVQSAMYNTKTQAKDEYIIKFKGHNIMKQYVKNKLIKWGFKMRCRALIYLILVWIWFIHRKEKRLYWNWIGRISCVAVIWKLTGYRRRTTYILIIVTTTPISNTYILENRNIKACGTGRSNRNILKYMPIDKNMNRGDIFAVSSNGISFIKKLFLLSNFLSPIPTASVKRRLQGSGEKLT